MNTLQQGTNNVVGAFSKFQAKLIALNQGIQVLKDLSATFRETAEPGLKLNASLHELSAIAGVTGEKLQEIEKSAREAAKTFGGSAARGVESYKLILSQLSPELGKVPKALSAMGNSALILSKTMENDVVAATEVLTTAMNQFQVSLEDPIKAAEEMARMMNIMAAAAREGSAELPVIKLALEQAGMAAKMAGVSFAETNAAIQVLDKAGKKGAEGGVALRNVLATLSQGRFLPKEVQEELRSAGVSIELLADKSLPLSERLSGLKSILNDSALVTKLFGKENNNAALALISGISSIKQYTDAIVDTNSAEEQAAIIMQSKQEQLARIKAKVDDFKIAIFNATGNLLPFSEIMTSALVPISQMIPLIAALAKGIKSFSFTSIIAGFAAFKVAAVTACRAVGVAIMNIPVFGWIAAALAALAAAVAWAWNKFEGFRQVVFGVWQVVKTFGETLYNSVLGTIKNIISGLGSLGSALSKLFKLDFKGAAEETKAAFSNFGKANPINIGVSIASADYSGAWQKGKQQGSDSFAKSQSKKIDETTDATIDFTNALADLSTTSAETSANLGGTSKVISELKSKLNSITEVNSLFGSAQEALKEKTDAVKSAIVELIEKGYKIQNSEIQTALEMMSQLRKEAQAFAKENTLSSFITNINKTADKKLKKGITTPDIKQTKVVDVNLDKKALEGYDTAMKKATASYTLFGDSGQYVGEKMNIARTAIEDLLNKGFSPSSRAIKRFVAEFKKASDTIVVDISSYVSGAITSLAEGLGNAIGSGDWANSFKSVLIGLMDILKQFGAALIAQGIAVKAFQLSISNPYAAIAAGIGLVAAASAAQAAMQKTTKFAAGGIVSGPTLAMVGEYPGASNNPEVIAPLDKLRNLISNNESDGEVKFIIEQDKLVGILNKYNKKRRLS
ncbi:MAG: phage tail tape measure protein [Bacteroidetes bacterium HGW-Bacteroidetes-7]|nr:MAG: phage tail tape measure protein [Bacteroidetes bacterium HGW-Bacteroidetes-7]